MAGYTGTWTEEYQMISENTELHVGDIVDLDFSIMSLFDWQTWQAVELAMIEERFEKDDRFTLLRHSYPENNVVTFRVRVDKNPIAVAAIIALILSVAVPGLIVWLALREIRLILVGGGEVARSTINLTLIVALAIAGLVALQWLRRKS